MDNCDTGEHHTVVIQEDTGQLLYKGIWDSCDTGGHRTVVIQGDTGHL